MPYPTRPGGLPIDDDGNVTIGCVVCRVNPDALAVDPEAEAMEISRLPSPTGWFNQALEMAAQHWIAVYGSGPEPYSTTWNKFLWAAESAWFEERDRIAAWNAPPPEPPPDPRPPVRGCHLYRLWDDEDRLVYVGVSRCLRSRLRAHRRTWDTTVWARATWEEHPDVPSMFAAEREAIANEAPPLNIAGVR